ncbi:MAG: hypothetical protein WCG84_01580 [Candidatus Moraniibacteriota bacterium]
MQKLLSFIDRLEGVHLPTVAEGIVQQLQGYTQALVALENKRGRDVHSEDEQKMLAMLYFKLWQFTYSREQRAEDTDSSEVVEADRIVQKLFPLGIPRLMLCVDGRVLSKLVAGLHEGSFRVPAGDDAEFVPHREGSGLFLPREAFLTTVLERAFSLRDTVVQVFDSHLHCAARKSSETERLGMEPADDGVLQDVLRKKAMGEALKEYVDATFHDTKRVYAVQISFNPLDGYCYMGLEKDECLNHPAVFKTGFTTEVLDALVTEGKIISTREFVEGKHLLQDIFIRYFFDVNYETDYRHSTLSFWKNMDTMMEECMPIIRQELVRVFPYLSDGTCQDELRERATLLLANAYNAFLHNFDKQQQSREYPYDQHDESVVTVAYGDRGPYDRARSFSVDPNNPDLSYVVRFTAGLIRNNRRAERYSGTESEALRACYGEHIEHYPQNPVPIFFFERIDVEPSAEIVQALQRSDWSDIVDMDWMNMTDQQFERYLNNKVSNIPAIVARKINALRLRAADLFRSGRAATEDLLEGRLVPVWTLSAPDRRTLAIFPFIAKGYEEK